MKRSRVSILFSMVLVVLACAGVYLAGNGRVSLWDRDEPRYAVTSRQMLTSGDWIVPMFLGQPRLAKPPLIYWLQAGAIKVMGSTDAAVRMPSVLATVLLLIVLGATVWKLAGPRRALWTVLIFGTSGLTIAASKMCLTDATLTLFITIAQLCIYQLSRGRRSLRTFIALGVAVGLAGITKGPIVLGVIAMTLLVLYALRFFPPRDPNEMDESRRSGGSIFTGLLIAGAIVLAIAAPWFVAMEQRIPGYLRSTFFKEIVRRSAQGAEGHWAPPGYYLATVWITFFPWSLLLPAAIVTAWKNRHLPIIRFALAAAVGPWLMFEIVSTKLPHYLLPIFPFLALLTAETLIRAHRRRIDDFANRGFFVAAGIWMIVVALVGAAPWLLLIWYPDLALPVLVFMTLLSILAVVYARCVYQSFRSNRALRAAAVMGVGAIVLVGIIYAGILPSLTFLQLSRDVASLLPTRTAVGDAIMIDYKEPSLGWYQGGTIREEPNDNYLVETDPSHWPTWIVVSDKVWSETPVEARVHLKEIGRVTGLAYARGKDKHVTVIVLRRR